MTSPANSSHKLKLKLLEKGLITEAKFQESVKKSEQEKKSLVETLYKSGIPERDLMAALVELYGYPPINVATFIISPEVLKLIPVGIANKKHVIPVTCYESTLTVAMLDPTNLYALDDLRALAGLRIKPTLALPSQLETAIDKYYGEKADPVQVSPQTLSEIVKDVNDAVSAFSIGSGNEASDLMEEASATPIIRLVNYLLMEAIRKSASDIFVEPWEKTMRVRLRVDGLLEEVIKIPRGSVEAIISRIKVMGRLNIAEHRIPQDGRIRVRILGREVDLRVSILPTSFGEKCCIRILDSTSQAQKLENLGFGPKELDMIRRNSKRPHGMLLVTGPTGSGKTTTLYSILKYLDTPEKNITTVEDPVEYQVSGINQVNVRDSVGLTFSAALRSILRQDPDIILIGEIRDQDTMGIAIKAALTGHLVLSTLHTNDATSAIVRMVNMGIEPFLIASSVLMISAQRLVRKLCVSCRLPYEPETLALEPPLRDQKVLFKASGCNQCRSSGYKGRLVIAELFEMKPALLELIMRGASGEELRKLARQNGMRTLREDGFQKAKEGLTSIEEVLRVTSPEPVLMS